MKNFIFCLSIFLLAIGVRTPIQATSAQNILKIKAVYTDVDGVDSIFRDLTINNIDSIAALRQYMFDSMNTVRTTFYNRTQSDARYLQSVPAQSFSSLTGKPTTLGGYGITDAYPFSGNPSNFLTSITGGQVTTALGYTPYNSSNPSGYITASSTNTLTNKSGNIGQWTNDVGYLTNATAGFGVSVIGSTNKTISIDTNQIMTVTTAGDSISSIKSSVNGKVPNNRTLTINGSTQDLSANRIWTLSTTDISEGTNQYYTNARSRSSISLTTTGTSGASTYNSSTGVLNIPQYTTSSGTVTSVATGTGLTGGPITTSGTISLANTAVSAGDYDGGFTVDAQGRLTNAYNPSFNNAPGRSISTTGSNNTFTISATKRARVNYTINFSYALTLTTSNGKVTLDYSTDAGSNWTTVASVSSAFTVAITLTGNADNNLSGEIPAGALVRINRTANTNVTSTIGAQQEVTY